MELAIALLVLLILEENSSTTPTYPPGYYAPGGAAVGGPPVMMPNSAGEHTTAAAIGLGATLGCAATPLAPVAPACGFAATELYLNRKNIGKAVEAAGEQAAAVPQAAAGGIASDAVKVLNWL